MTNDDIPDDYDGRQIFGSTEGDLGLTAKAFASMPENEQIDFVHKWFFSIYEDPANEISYNGREGGYQWTGQGPHNARDVIIDEFADVLDEELLDSVVQQIERDGWEWARKYPPLESDKNSETLLSGGGPLVLLDGGPTSERDHPYALATKGSTNSAVRPEKAVSQSHDEMTQNGDEANTRAQRFGFREGNFNSTFAAMPPVDEYVSLETGDRIEIRPRFQPTPPPKPAGPPKPTGPPKIVPSVLTEREKLDRQRVYREQKMMRRIEDLEAHIRSLPPMQHNGGPPLDDDDGPLKIKDLRDVLRALTDIKIEAGKAVPDTSQVKKNRNWILKFLVGINVLMTDRATAIVDHVLTKGIDYAWAQPAELAQRLQGATDAIRDWVTVIEKMF